MSNVKFPDVAWEGDFGPSQISHRAEVLGEGRFVTACGKEFGGIGNTHPDWFTWGVSGPFDDDERPEITCPRCAARPTAPDRPGHRDQQQAAEDALIARYNHGYVTGYEKAYETARAEEAARWRAKIEALAAALEREGVSVPQVGRVAMADRLRATLGG